MKDSSADRKGSEMRMAHARDAHGTCCRNVRAAAMYTGLGGGGRDYNRAERKRYSNLLFQGRVPVSTIFTTYIGCNPKKIK